MADFGTCWSATPTLTFPSTQASGFRVVAEAIVRRWSTPRGRLIDDGNYGYDLTDLVQGDFDVHDVPRIAQQAGAEAEKDERVQSCSCTASFDGDTLAVTGNVQTAQGPFRLVVTVKDFAVILTQVST